MSYLGNGSEDTALAAAAAAALTAAAAAATFAAAGVAVAILAHRKIRGLDNWLFTFSPVVANTQWSLYRPQ